MVKSIDREKLFYEAVKYKYDFRKFKTTRTFGRDIYEGKISLEQAHEEQSFLANEIDKFIEEKKPKNVEKKTRKKSCFQKFA